MGPDRDILIQDNRKISIRLEQLANQAMAQQELTACQARVLLYILRRGAHGISLTELHRQFGYSMAALSAQTKHLREKGYLQAVPRVGDDRCKLLSGTEKGIQMQHSLTRSIHRIQNLLYSSFSPAELDTLNMLQKKMLRNLSALSNNSKEVEKL